MKNWQSIIVTMAAIVYLDDHFIPWIGHYIVHGKEMLKYGYDNGEKYFQKYENASSALSHLIKDAWEDFKKSV